MAEIRVENLNKTFGDFVAVQRFQLHRARHVVLRDARAVGLRQDDDTRMIAGLELPTSGQDPARRGRRRLQAGLGARHRLRVPALRPLPAHERQAEYRLPAGLPGRAGRRNPTRASRRRRSSSHRPSPRPIGLGAGRRRPAARGAGPRHRQPAEGLPDGRAARHARHRVPRPDDARSSGSSTTASAPPPST